MPGALIALIAAILLVPQSFGAVPRSAQAKAEFKHMQPCPATGKPRGPCPGYVIDHVRPLCAGGADDPLNMQWQTIADAKAKDRLEVAECRALRRN